MSDSSFVYNCRVISLGMFLIPVMDLSLLLFRHRWESEGRVLFYKSYVAVWIWLLCRYKVYKAGNFFSAGMCVIRFWHRLSVRMHFH